MANSIESLNVNENEPTIKECSICLELYHNPCQILPCLHVYCDPCLRRLNDAGTSTCPLCRENIEECYLDLRLDKKIKEQNCQSYLARQEKEEKSGVYDLPLPAKLTNEKDDLDRIKHRYRIEHKDNIILITIMFVSYIFAIYNGQLIIKQWLFD